MADANDTTPRRAARPVRYGVIDVGSNAIRLQLVETSEPDGEPIVLHRHREPVRLGRDVFLTGRIPPATQAAAAGVVRRFRALCDQYGAQQIRTIATAAVREAGNRAEVLARIHAESGLTPEVISGGQEAYYLSWAVAMRVDLSQGRSVLVDVGGGSVEVTLLDQGRVRAADSYPLGAVRLLELAAAVGDKSEPVSIRDLLEQHVARFDHRIAGRIGEGAIDRFLATGGNIESLADLQAAQRRGSRPHGVESLSRTELGDWITRLASLSIAQRIERLGLVADRADVILPAAIVFDRIAGLAHASQVLVPRVGLGDGLVREVIDARGGRRENLLELVAATQRRFDAEIPHAESVCRHALALFDASQPLHGLGEDERLLLEVAALLHDVGTVVSNEDHHRHGEFLVRGTDWIGLGETERSIVALLVRYHRGDAPSVEHRAYAALSATDRDRVRILAALLRLADALDRGHRNRVAGVDLRVEPNAVVLHLHSRVDTGDPFILERQALRAKGSLFDDVFGTPLRVE